MNYLDIIDITATGLRAGRVRMNVIAQNIANAETTQTAQGGPYRRKIVILRQQQLTNGNIPLLSNSLDLPFASALMGMMAEYQPYGVQVAEVTEDTSPLPRTYDPSHPNADADGYVQMPNVQLPMEMVDLVAAAEAYEANAAVLEVVGKVIGDTINLLQ